MSSTYSKFLSYWIDNSRRFSNTFDQFLTSRKLLYFRCIFYVERKKENLVVSCDILQSQRASWSRRKYLVRCPSLLFLFLRVSRFDRNLHHRFPFPASNFQVARWTKNRADPRSSRSLTRNRKTLETMFLLARSSSSGWVRSRTSNVTLRCSTRLGLNRSGNEMLRKVVVRVPTVGKRENSTRIRMN